MDVDDLHLSFFFFFEQKKQEKTNVEDDGGLICLVRMNFPMVIRGDLPSLICTSHQSTVPCG